MAMVENSGMVLNKDVTHHGNLNLGLGSLSPHWYHTSLSTIQAPSLSANQANLRSGSDPNTHSPASSLSYHSPSLSSSSSDKEDSLLLLEKTKEKKKEEEEDQVGAQEQEKEKEKERENGKDYVGGDPKHVETETDDNSKKVLEITSNSVGVDDPLNNGGEIVIRKLEEDRFSTLNPLAKEFVPPSKVVGPTKALPDSEAVTKGNTNRRKKGNSNQGKRRINSRILKAQREESIRRTVYVSDIDQQVTEEQLAALFITCSQVVDCRICGDPNSVLRFAFVEFTNEEGARAALGLSGTKLGFYPVRVLPSKTAIVPVNPTFLPRSELERELCARTIYCTNIDKKVSQADVKLFFETLCGEVSRLRLLGDFHHSTRIAFVEFILAESAMYALNCSGAILGSLPIRVSPSKTPVRPCGPRPHLQ